MDGTYKSKPLAWAVYTVIILIGIIFLFAARSEPDAFNQNLLLNIGSNFIVLTLVFIVFQLFREKSELDLNNKSDSTRKTGSQEVSLSNESEVNNYMYDWISTGRRVVIFTRDMSWASDKRIIEVLTIKAHNNELTICLPQHIQLTQKLEHEGAQIVSYSQLEYTPQSRFTIINKDRADAQVAIGFRRNKKHVIQEYSSGDNAIFSLTNDLVEILSRVSRN
jgi:hypothetical protein